MLPVYSTLFYAQHDLSGDSGGLGPADGTLWVIRGIDAVNGELVNNIVAYGTAEQLFWANSFGGTIAFDYASYRGRMVVPEGQTVHLQTTAAMDVCMWGYTLTLP